MLAAVAVALPVAWIYTLTRSKRGYQQSVVQLLIILPVVVAGIVVMVKYSIALAFSLGGIAAAVRFRNSLDDSKDAVYVFLVTGIGMAAAVDLPVALVISVVFNAIIVVALDERLWAHAGGARRKHGRATAGSARGSSRAPERSSRGSTTKCSRT